MRHSINIGRIKPRIPNLGAFFNNSEGPLRIAVIYPCRWSRSRFWGGMCTVNRYCGCFKHGVQRSHVALYNLKSKICEWVWWDIVVKDSRQKKKVKKKCHDDAVNYWIWEVSDNYHTLEQIQSKLFKNSGTFLHNSPRRPEPSTLSPASL